MLVLYSQMRSGWDPAREAQFLGQVRNQRHKGLVAFCSPTKPHNDALLADLARRGLLDETLVLFGSEFGRMPTAQGPDGRDHNITGYSMWLAGAGVKPGQYSDVVRVVDIAPTLAAILGVKPMEPLDGRVLTPVVR